MVEASREANMTIPTTSKILLLFSSGTYSLLLVIRYPVPPITIAEITPIKISDIDIHLYLIWRKVEYEILLLYRSKLYEKGECSR